DVEDDFATAALEPVSTVVGRHEPLVCLAVGDDVTGRDNWDPFGAKDLDECLSVPGAKGANERVDRVVQGIEALLPGRILESPGLTPAATALLCSAGAGLASARRRATLPAPGVASARRRATLPTPSVASARCRAAASPAAPLIAAPAVGVARTGLGTVAAA